VQEARAAWREKQKTMDPSKLVFLDETSKNCAMTRLYGRAKGKARVNDYVPDVRFKRTSTVSTIRLNGEKAPYSFKGTLNGARFAEYISNILVPTMYPGDILVLDHCSAHTLDALKPLLEAGCSYEFLPVYSPDLNPIEPSWSKMKSKLRELKPRTDEELEIHTKTALDSFTKSDLLGWFSSCGYVVNE
jgi:transposase